MDKGWMNAPKFSQRHVKGVQSFMQLVRSHFKHTSKVRCPCPDCLNIYFQTQDVVYDHLLLRGIMESYVQWIHHGEQPQGRDNTEAIYNEDDNEEDGNEEDMPTGDEIHDMLKEVGGSLFSNLQEETNTSNNICGDMREKEAKNFDKLLEEAERELYPGCNKFSKLSFLVKLLHLKVYNQWSNKSFNMLLGLLREALPNGEALPKSYYDARKMLQGLGLGYISIHACKYDCALYWGEFKDRQECPHCGTSRWKTDKGKNKKIPHKVLRYFPLKPRLQRLFMSRKTSEDMRWHKEKYISEANVLRHPVDSEAWKEFDNDHPWFAQEPRNVRLGLATDGFNPFGNMSTSYSMWPVILFPYNLPPWKCFKDPFMMMSLLIPGPQAPGKDIDIYLRPLVDELKELWSEGVETFDASTEERFKMHAAVLWTINDFPAYGNLSGWSTKGYMACPVCNKDTSSQRLRSKISYMGHRRYLEPNHTWRKSKKFDGKIEKRTKPKELSGNDILQQLDVLSTYRPGKHPNIKKIKRLPEELNWVRKSIFFELPYWKSLKLRHNLDVMHIEKNICESILGTLLNDGKTKDTYKARQDLQDMNIRKELWLKHSGSTCEMPLACYHIKPKEIKKFCAFLKSVKFPDGYASNISRCGSEDAVKLSGLKSHDYHVLLQRVLPIAVRKFVNKDVSSALIELGHFFQRLCCKTLRRDDLEQLERDIYIILCKLELLFPPAFFDVMVHLAVHLPREAIYGGPVQYRWMYKIERFLCKLKRYVRNKARAEGSIAEGYLIDECLTFCSMYLTGIETRFNREDRNDDGSSKKNEFVLDIFSKNARPFAEQDYDEILRSDFAMARWYVLNNCEEVEPFLEEHKEELANQVVVDIEVKHREQFHLWFKRKIIQLHKKGKSMSIKKLYPLAMGPDMRVRTYAGCIVNGVRYHIQSRDDSRKSQNCSIVVEGYHENELIDFYGVIVGIVELEFIDNNRVVLFRCKWFDLRKKTGMQKDKYFTSINVSRFWYEHDPFVLATQARQVFYIDDPKLGENWRIVQKFQDRHLYDVPEMQNLEVEIDVFPVNDEVYQDVSLESNIIINDKEDLPTELHRDDVEFTTVDASIFEMDTPAEYEVGSNQEDSDQEDDSMVEYISDNEGNEGNNGITSSNDEDGDSTDDGDETN